MTSVMENPPSVEREVKNPVEPITGKEVDMRAFAADIKEKISQGDVYGAAREFAYARQANLEVDGKSKKIRISPGSKSGQELMTVFREGVDKYKDNPRVLAHYLMYLKNTEAFGKKRGETEETEMDRIVEEHRDTLERYYKRKLTQSLEDRAKNFSSTLVALRSLGILKVEDIDGIEQCGVEEAVTAMRDIKEDSTKAADGKFTKVLARVHYILRGLDEDAARGFRDEAKRDGWEWVMDKEVDAGDLSSSVTNIYLRRTMGLATDDIDERKELEVRAHVSAVHESAANGERKWEDFLKAVYPLSRLAEFNEKGMKAAGPASDPEEDSQLLAQELGAPAAKSTAESGLDDPIADEENLSAAADMFDKIAENDPGLYKRYSELILKVREVDLTPQESAELLDLEHRIEGYADSVNLGSDLIRNSLYSRFIRERQSRDVRSDEDLNKDGVTKSSDSSAAVDGSELQENENLSLKEQVEQGLHRLSESDEHFELLTRYMDFMENKWKKRGMSRQEKEELIGLEGEIAATGLASSIGQFTRDVAHRVIREAS